MSPLWHTLQKLQSIAAGASTKSIGGATWIVIYLHVQEGTEVALRGRVRVVASAHFGRSSGSGAAFDIGDILESAVNVG